MRDWIRRIKNLLWVPVLTAVLIITALSLAGFKYYEEAFVVAIVSVSVAIMSTRE